MCHDILINMLCYSNMLYFFDSVTYYYVHIILIYKPLWISTFCDDKSCLLCSLLSPQNFGTWKLFLNRGNTLNDKPRLLVSNQVLSSSLAWHQMFWYDRFGHSDRRGIGYQHEPRVRKKVRTRNLVSEVY